MKVTEGEIATIGEHTAEISGVQQGLIGRVIILKVAHYVACWAPFQLKNKDCQPKKSMNI